MHSYNNIMNFAEPPGDEEPCFLFDQRRGRNRRWHGRQHWRQHRHGKVKIIKK